MDIDLSRLVLYAPETLRAVTGYYNHVVFPAQIVAALLALAAAGLARWRRGRATPWVALILAVFWVWCAVTWFGDHYLAINWVGLYYGLAFGLQAVLLTVYALSVYRDAEPTPVDAAAWAGWSLAAVVLAVHPLIERLSGANPTELQYAGTSPDPVVVLTLGLLATTGRRVPPWLLVIPALWLLLSGFWTVLLGVPLRLVLPALGLAGIALIVAANRVRRRVAAA